MPTSSIREVPDGIPHTLAHPVKLTRSKSAPGTEEQLAKYRKETRMRDVWKSDVDKLKAIVNDLEKAYEEHKGDFALQRYEELKDMIKSSIERLHKVLSETGRSGTMTGRPDTGRAAKYQTSATSRLKNTAEQFSQSNNKTSDSILAEELTTGELTDATESVHKEVINLKHAYRTIRDSLECLSKEYEQSKSMNPAQRFATLKEMIKTVIAKTSACH